ncbi:MAG: lipopolysaccharide heptosyltransferase II [Candidatus Azotimanducaceae bacterium]
MAHSSEVKLLIVAPAWVGDMVMAHSLIQSLSNRPVAKIIDVLAPPSSLPIASRMHEVRKTYVLDVGHGRVGLGARIKAAALIREESYDEVYVLPNSWKSALVPFLARIKKRIGWLGEMRFGILNDARSLDKNALPLMVERYSALSLDKHEQFIRPALDPVLQFDAENQSRLFSRFNLSATGAIALAPGAEFGPAKKWPVSYFADVANYCLDNGRQVWLLGSEKDGSDCELIENKANGAINLAGKTSLEDVVDLISLADTLVCNDSGLMHISAALNTKTVALFGSTSSEYTPPLSKNSWVVSRELDCRPCFQRVCPLGHMDCLRKIEATEVISILDI